MDEPRKRSGSSADGGNPGRLGAARPALDGTSRGSGAVGNPGVPPVSREPQAPRALGAVPDFQSLMLPVLRGAAEGSADVSAAVERARLEFALSEDDLAELLPSGRKTRIRDRVEWARTYMAQAGLLERTARGQYRVTERGREVLARNPARVDVKLLREFPEFRAFEERSRAARGKAAAESPQAARALEALTPEEQIESAGALLEESLAQDLVQRVRRVSPAFFERLIVDLLLKMGYGYDFRADSGSRVGGPRDHGVDGIIHQDVLGLDIVYLQAKRYQAERSVSEEQVRGFSGALLGKGATKGVFVTTSSFTPDARSFAAGLRGQRVRLVDGEELARLMIEHGIGVRTERSVEIKRPDLDYFLEGDQALEVPGGRRVSPGEERAQGEPE